MSELKLLESIHPQKPAEEKFKSLVGIDEIKTALVDELCIMLDRDRLNAWEKKHHPKGLPLLKQLRGRSPLIVLEGDVGCGKTALASCVGSVVAREIDQRIACLETPSNVRGKGHVGELSDRVTEAFAQAKPKISAVGRGIIVIDEADDLATERSQMQAHHEDRAGVNVLIKQLDQLAANPHPTAVIMITNRANVLDPAILRRAALRLTFSRPGGDARRAVFEDLLDGTNAGSIAIDELVKLTQTDVPYTFSDLTNRLAGVALRTSWKTNVPFSAAALKAAIASVPPSPLLRT